MKRKVKDPKRKINLWEKTAFLLELICRLHERLGPDYVTVWHIDQALDCCIKGNYNTLYTDLQNLKADQDAINVIKKRAAMFLSFCSEDTVEEIDSALRSINFSFANSESEYTTS